MRKILLVLFVTITLTLLCTASATEVNESVEVNTVDNIEEQDNNQAEIINKKDIQNDNTKTATKTTTKTVELDDETEGTGCTTTIIQGFNNDSALSFRRDATNKLTVNVKHDNSIVKQYKEGSYFFHVIVSKDGWMVGNGGADNAQVNHAIENNAMSMIKNNAITSYNMNNIYSQESRLSLGHFVIKAPNGTFSLIIKNGRRVYKNQGTLKAGEYLIVPNSLTYYRRSSLTGIKDESGMILSSRMLAARDYFGVNRREIVTYYYKNNRVNSTVKVTVTNDNGKYVGRRTGSKIDNFQTNTNYYSSSSIPVIDGSKHLDTVNFFIRKAKTSITVNNITTNTDKVTLTGVIRDEFGYKVNTGKVSVIVNGKTLKYSNGKTIFVKVNNGTVNYTTKLKTLWTRKNHTYSMTYQANDKYNSNKSGNAHINVEDFFKIDTTHYKNIFYGSKLNIKTTVKYLSNNTGVTGGKVFYKINGKTILNSKNTTLLRNVNKGKAEYNYTLGDAYRAKTYTITTVYINGVYRKEVKTNITIKKIPPKITQQNITVKKDTVHFKAKLVDKYNKTIRYNSYLTIKINNKTLKENATTVKYNITKGYISFKFKVPTEQKKITLTIQIPESKERLAYNKTFTIKV